MGQQISIVRLGSSWAIMHGDGFLGEVASLEEATAISHHLMDQTAERIERRAPAEAPRSWRPPPPGGDVASAPLKP